MSVLSRHLSSRLSSDAGRIVVAGPGTRTTRGDLLAAAAKLAGFFAERGAATGERVLISSADDAITTAAYLGSVLSGHTAVLVDPAAPPAELLSIFELVRPRFAVTGEGALLEPARGALLGHVITRVDRKPGLKDRLLGRRTRVEEGPSTTWSSILARPEGTAPPREPDDAATAHVLFTSGTTGGRRGVRITHANLSAHLATLARCYGYDDQVRVMNGMPLHHTDGLSQGALLAAWCGGSVYRPEPFSIAAIEPWLDAVYRERITHLYTTPAVLALLLRLRQSSRDAFRTQDFRFIISSAGYLHEKLWREVEEYFGVPVINVYGLTETVSGSLYCGPSPDTRRIGTLGRPADCEVRISDGEGRECPVGQVGELWLRGDHVTPGYLDPAQDRESFAPGGWFRTGDLVRLDDAGFIVLAGRSKNVIIRGGTTISPEEITRLVRAMPGITDAETVGLEDDTWGERVVTCVLLAPGAGLDATAITEHCRLHLAPEKVPTDVLLLPSLPRGPAGKVTLPALREQARAALSARASGGGANAQDVAAAVLDAAAAAFRRPRASLSLASEARVTPGWDSLGHMELITRLEERFRVRFSARQITSIERLADSARVLAELLAAQPSPDATSRSRSP